MGLEAPCLFPSLLLPPRSDILNSHLASQRDPLLPLPCFQAAPPLQLKSREQTPQNQSGFEPEGTLEINLMLSY